MNFYNKYYMAFLQKIYLCNFISLNLSFFFAHLWKKKDTAVASFILIFMMLAFPVFTKENSKDLSRYFQFCENDQVKKIEEIEDIQSKIEFINKKGSTLLAYCLEQKAEKSSLYLLQFIQNKNYEDINRYNYATLAVRAGLKNPLFKLLKENPDLLYSKDRFKYTLLDHAIVKKRKEILKGLLESYPEYFQKNRTSFPTVLKAVESNSIEILELILPNKPNLKEAEESILLQKSVEFSTSTIGYLLNLGLNINSRDEKGNTILHKIALMNHFELLEYLKNFPILMVKNLEGQLPIHIAAKNGRTKVFKKLLETGGVNEQDVYGNSPLHLASEFGDTEMLYHGILSNPSLNQKNKKGETPLNIAKLSGNESNYYLLLLAGAVE